MSGFGRQTTIWMLPSQTLPSTPVEACLWRVRGATSGCESGQVIFIPFWQVLILHRVGTSSEHHSLYQYQLAHTQDIFLGQMQSETAYYQPRPAIGTPFPPVESLNDPHASELCKNGTGNCDGYGLRILESQHVAIYGAGLYSFFDDYDECKNLPFRSRAAPGSASNLEY